MADYTVYLQPNEASIFNDTNGDGLGEFEGWGTSLCWWANRLGYNKNLIDQAVQRFYSEDGLNLNIGRYNIGGGDNVKETFHTPYYIDGINKTVIYDLQTSGLKPEFFGTNMSINSVASMSDATYTVSDSDFGIMQNNTVGNINTVGYINKLDEDSSYGGNLIYSNINVCNNGRYTVKFLLMFYGENDRDIAIRVNNTSKYTMSAEAINNNIIATKDEQNIYLITFDGVYLAQGVNTIQFGSDTADWCLDVIKMAVVRSKSDEYYTDWLNVPPNKNADIYDCSDYRRAIYNGSSMEVINITALQDATFSSSDTDFGIEKGIAVGPLEAINYINKLDDNISLGGNVKYNVDIKENGDYAIKLIMALEGELNRDLAIRVNGVKYCMNVDTIINSVIAQSDIYNLIIASFNNITLVEGLNTITIGGYTGWTLDLVKMAVVKNSSQGVLSENDDFLHEAHINRSDSRVPGYCCDVTKITNEHTLHWYETYFERVDEECGYAWNYNWSADKNQMNITKAIAKEKGAEFIAEAFSNSPPYFMTNSGCTSGATDSSQNNLRDDSYNAFAKYLADVIAHINEEDNGITFTSATGMNEPYTNYWGANSNKQEGCHVDQGYAQSRIIEALNWNLQDKGVTNCIVSGTDETSIDTMITSYNALTDGAKNTISRIDTHTYSGSDRAGLRTLAENEGKNLWMSEVDGDFTNGTDAGEMAGPLGLAYRIIEDLMWMKPSAWILWNIVDMHCDTGNVHDGNDFSWLNTYGGYWGLTACNHDDEYIWCLKKYYAYGQFTRYIRPGYAIFPIDWNAIGAYDPDEHKVVIVVINTEGSDKTYQFSFDQFSSMTTTNITAIRTSGALDGGENWADVSTSCNIDINVSSKYFTAILKANSITTFIVPNANK